MTTTDKSGYLRDELFTLMRTNEDAFDFLINSVLDGVWYANLDNLEEEWLSPSYKALFGYAEDEIENSAAWWRDNMFPEDVELAEENYRKALADPRHRYEHVVRFRHKSGRTIWVHCRGQIIRDDDGRPVRLLGCHVDATRLMEMEQLDRFGTVIEHCITEIYLFDAATLRFIQVNGGARSRLGYSMSELKSMTPLDIAAFGSRDYLESQLAPLVRREATSVTLETLHRCKDGSTYPVEAHFELSDTPARSVYIAFVADISERLSRDRELEATKEYTEIILNSVSDGIAGLLPVVEDGEIVDYRIVAANHAMRRQFHRYGGPLIGTCLTDVLPDFRHSQLFARLRETEERGGGFAVEIGPSDTGLEWYLVRAVRTANGGITITFVNITDAKQREISLKKSNDALKQFSAIVSHDLQAPLRHIGLFSEMLEGKLTNADKEVTFLTGRIRENITRMQRMISSLLDYTSVAYAQIGSQEVALDRIAAEAIHLLDADISASGTVVDVGPLPTVIGDPELLTRLFQNLISNAIKYSGDRPPSVAISAARKGAYWQLAIADNGIGIDPRFAERIFEVFTRLHRDERTYTGMGIGLALCRQIVESHKGEIWLDTSYLHGARFCFTFPAV